MRIPRVYIADSLPSCGEMTLPEAQSHYLHKVLRMENGRELVVFCGDGFEYSARIHQADKRATQIEIHKREWVERESPLPTHLAIAVSRGDRMDWVLQKATELGATRITPLFSERTEVRLKGERLHKKMAHWQQIIVSSCEQCQRNVLPQLQPACTLEQFFLQPNTDTKLVLHHRSQQNFKDMPHAQAVTLLIGPEGGLSDAEINIAMHTHQFQALTLGPRVLRTETAPIAALTAVQLQWGDLG